MRLGVETIRLDTIVAAALIAIGIALAGVFAGGMDTARFEMTSTGLVMWRLDRWDGHVMVCFASKGQDEFASLTCEQGISRSRSSFEGARRIGTLIP